MNRDHQTIRAAITNEVIRAVAALRQQRTVAREQYGQTVFVPGTEAAREYLIETLDRAFGDSTPPATPVTRIEQIRQRFERRQPCERYRDELEDDPVTRYVCGKCDYDEDAHQIAELLTLWDTRDAALRTLVEQLKSEAEAVPLRRTGDLGRRDALVRSLLTKCVDALDAILKETTP